ncbi:hypothetical protein PENTCL1PPCAC_7414, partial [Pristionchus entomophagus]
FFGSCFINLRYYEYRMQQPWVKWIYPEMNCQLMCTLITLIGWNFPLFIPNLLLSVFKLWWSDLTTKTTFSFIYDFTFQSITFTCLEPLGT